MKTRINAFEHVNLIFILTPFPVPLPLGRIVVLKPPKNLGKKWGHFLKPWESQTRCHSCQNQVLPSSAVPSPTCPSLTRGEMACSWMNHVKRMRMEDKNIIYIYIHVGEKAPTDGNMKKTQRFCSWILWKSINLFLHLLHKKKKTTSHPSKASPVTSSAHPLTSP